MGSVSAPVYWDRHRHSARADGEWTGRAGSVSNAVSTGAGCDAGVEVFGKGCL